MTADTTLPAAVSRFESAVTAVARSVVTFGTVYDTALIYELDAARAALLSLCPGDDERAQAKGGDDGDD